MLKNLKRGDVVSIDWINAGDLDDCQVYGALFVGYASKKIRAFYGSNEKGSDLKVRYGVHKPKMLFAKSLKNGDPTGNRTPVSCVRG